MNFHYVRITWITEGIIVTNESLLSIWSFKWSLKYLFIYFSAKVENKKIKSKPDWTAKVLHNFSHSIKSKFIGFCILLFFKTWYISDIIVTCFPKRICKNPCNTVKAKFMLELSKRNNYHLPYMFERCGPCFWYIFHIISFKQYSKMADKMLIAEKNIYLTHIYLLKYA